MDAYSDPRIEQGSVWSLGVSERADFIVRTYLHLLGAIVAFVCIEMAIFSSGAAERISRTLFGLPGGWLGVLGAFLIVSWIASGAAHRSKSLGVQYIALLAYVVAEALIFVPLLYIANRNYVGVISSAAAATLVGFVALTALAMITRKDFSFLGGIIMWGGICALMAIVGGVIFGFTLGPMFSVAMIALAGGSILYNTSNVLHHYPPNRYVAASLQLFASVALMFWYVLRLLMAARD